jgi:hypothetical protein
MQENINKLIDINLNLIANSRDGKLFRTDFIDENKRRLRDSKRFAEILAKKNLVDLEPTKEMRCDITEFGFEIANNGGWLSFLEQKKKKDELAKREREEKEKIQLELAKSNLEANELNKAIAKRNAKDQKNNRIATWINIGIGAINIGILIYQLLNSK